MVIVNSISQFWAPASTVRTRQRNQGRGKRGTLMEPSKGTSFSARQGNSDLPLASITCEFLYHIWGLYNSSPNNSSCGPSGGLVILLATAALSWQARGLFFWQGKAILRPPSPYLPRAHRCPALRDYVEFTG